MQCPLRLSGLNRLNGMTGQSERADESLGVVELARRLIRCRSVAPADDGAQGIIGSRLRTAGFSVNETVVDGVTSSWAILGQSGPVFAFAGHTDVVPPGPEKDWISGPFEPDIRDGRLYGRGAADMKGPVAAFISAIENFLKRNELTGFRIAVLLAGDEEPIRNHGTLDLLEAMRRKGCVPDFCIVTEPTSAIRLGDTVKVGRRGSMHGSLVVRGRQGHSAYPELADNAIHRAMPALERVAGIRLDGGNADFPPSTIQFTGVESGVGASNVVPGRLTANFNIRFSNVLTETAIRDRIALVLRESGIDFELNWSCDARPFLNSSPSFAELVSRSIREITGIVPNMATGGGTSDARFIAPTGAAVVEFGLVGESSHQLNESIAISDLLGSVDVYERILENFHGQPGVNG